MDEVISAAISLEEILQQPAGQILVLTVNNRLSRTLTSQYARSAGKKTSELPAILPLNSWLSQVAFEQTFSLERHNSEPDPDLVLTPLQSRILWADIIQSGYNGDQLHGLIDVQQLAGLAQQADELSLHWQVKVDPSWETPEYQQFSQWQSEYEQRLEDLSAVDRTRLLPKIARWIKDGRLQLPQMIVFAGFVSQSPALAALMLACKCQGAEIRHFVAQTSLGQARVGKVCVPDQKTEWELAIDWIREQLQQYPSRRYAIVVPDLQQQAPKARRLLETRLGQPYNVAVAPALAQWPAASAMMLWLDLSARLLLDGMVTAETAGKALVAGHCIADEQEKDARVRVDVKWRRYQQLSVDLDAWRQVLVELPQLHAAWERVEKIWAGLEHGQKLRWEQWAELMRKTMAALGYPGAQARTSAQFQAVNAVDGLLQQLAMLDEMLPEASWSDAYDRLVQLAGQMPFQPQRDPRSRLDVLGLLEAEGGHWDGVWIMGLTDTVLPAPLKPNPLLPLPALEAAQAPRSNAEREFQWASRMFQELCLLGGDIVFSWPSMDDQQELRPSPFLQPIAWAEIDDQVELATVCRLPKQEWQDGPAVALSEDEKVSGGIDVLDTQSRNPMWAFLRHRLHVRSLPAHARLPSKALRGSFLHDVMRRIWQEVKNKDRLAQKMSQSGFDAWLSDIVQMAAQLHLQSWPRPLARLEEQRAVDLVRQWLEMENKRAFFEVVEIEQQYYLRFDRLSLKMVIDRVDHDEAGRLILVDYKTGMSVPSPLRDWMRPLPVDLQMIAYSKAINQNKNQWPAAVAWAQLNPRKLAFSGLRCEAVEIPGIKDKQTMPEDAWHQQLQQWGGALEQLAKDFTEGCAQNVSYRLKDLDYCDIRDLLRLHEEPDDE